MGRKLSAINQQLSQQISLQIERNNPRKNKNNICYCFSLFAFVNTEENWKQAINNNKYLKVTQISSGHLFSH